MKNIIIPVQAMYEQRTEFVIVALTGITGSGCSAFADVMCRKFADWSNKIRTKDEIKEQCNSNLKPDVVFAKEFEACRFFCEKNYKPFRCISYKNVLILYVIDYLSKKCISYADFKSDFLTIIKDKFRHSQSGEDVNYEFNADFSESDLNDWGFTENLYNSLSACHPKDESEFSKDSWRKRLAELFFSKDFGTLCQCLFNDLKQRDYYSKNFFVHRLANVIRATGDPLKNRCDYHCSVDTSHLFDIVDLINQIIKGVHLLDSRSPRRFVIDSIRNSMEIVYLRERYNSFYSIALHNDGHEFETLLDKVNKWEKDSHKCRIICDNIMRLSAQENKLGDFENGYFYAPDLSRCVSESELHISFSNKQVFGKDGSETERSLNALTFFSYAEQWMKFYSLICRPGIVTPSRDERCMSMAYVAKFSSGCISRQVGCVIVDKENSVQSVGWNDPPASQLPCNLRYVDEYFTEKQLYDELHDHLDTRIFSTFEMTDCRTYKLKDKHGNINNLQGFYGCLFADLPQKVLDEITEKGLRYPYCFRSRYNKYMGEKDYVNTRSLHAEENTMLRISRRGGVGLDGGTMYVTASPCILCSKKAYQIGIRDIVYLDPYTDIAPDLILRCGFDQPRLRPYRGAIGGTFNKLYQSFMPLKDELEIYSRTIEV